MKITLEQARQFFIQYHHLDGKYILSGKQGILDYIRKVGCIQFDPLNVVGHNPELVLQSRIDGFRPELLSELLYADRQLYDTWDKNMAICLVEDWPYFERMRKWYNGIHLPRFKGQKKTLNQMRQFIDMNGPVTSGDFDHNKKIQWPWGPTRFARAALESMFLWGELIIYHKLGTRKLYDFAKNHIEEKILNAEDPNQSDDAYFEWFLKRRIRSVGMLPVNSNASFAGNRAFKSHIRKKAVERLLEKGEISGIEIDSVKDTFYIAREDIPLLKSKKNKGKRRICILAALDNLLWDRNLINKIFEFEYVWEVYKPVTERKYGYYVLPVLFGNQFIARFEPAQDKKRRRLVVKNWWWEKGVKMNGAMEKALISGFKQFLNYLSLEKVAIAEHAHDKKTLKWTQEVIYGV